MKNGIKIKTAILLALIFLFSVSCTHNNGDIGPIFGNWKLQKIEKDGVLDDDYKGNIFFAFQNTVTTMSLVRADHSVDQRYGRWLMDGDDLLLIFDDERFVPIEEIGMKKGENRCVIKTLDSKNLVFSYAINGVPYTYTLVKW